MVNVAVIQMKMEGALEKNLEKACGLIQEAARQGAKLILLPEFFATPYFCQAQREDFFALAFPVKDHPFLSRFQELSRQLQVILPVSFFERAGPAYFNSLIGYENGEVIGLYRKSHIPDGPGYQEKFYFNPGNTGFQVWNTQVGAVGVAICWDQWFPEVARALTLQGADILLYPTAIGSEPAEELDTRHMWRRAMVGHAVCNSVYVAAANRIGQEEVVNFYGHSFISNEQGELLAHKDLQEEGVILSTCDFQKARRFRASMGFFRDRRPELYEGLFSVDGEL